MTSSFSIMVVDDEEEIRRFLATLLRRAGYEVATAEGPLQALDLLRQRPYALIITDLKMPDMDGLELLRHVAERHPSTRGIVLTGYGSIQSAVEATKLGADNYVTKPVATDEFLQAVRNTLREGRPLRSPPGPPQEVSSLAALTRLLAQPSLDLLEMVQGSVEIVASMFHGHARLQVFDADTGSELASAETDEFARLAPSASARPVTSGPHLQSGPVSRHSRVLSATLASNHGYAGLLQTARPREDPPFTKDEGQLLLLAANQMSIALGNLLAGHSLALTMRELRELSLQTVRALVRAVEMRDRYTAGHSARVSRYAVALARSLGLDPAEVENVRVAALLHDVGKVGISDLLLNKPGPLAPAERARIEEHPALGCQIVGGVQSLSASVPLIMHHQERYDGQGYPAQLAGSQIPYGARILAVADSFEAITATRAYREGRSAAEALEILRAGSGRQWDPLLVARWRRIVDRLLNSTGSE